MKNWYIVQSHSNFENKVAKIIKEEYEKLKFSEKIEEIIVPTHDVTEVRRGKRVQRKKKYFPGYVLIKSEMDNDLYHMIKNIKKVTGFLGSKGIPVPVSDQEKLVKFNWTFWREGIVKFISEGKYREAFRNPISCSVRYKGDMTIYEQLVVE